MPNLYSFNLPLWHSILWLCAYPSNGDLTLSWISDTNTVTVKGANLPQPMDLTLALGLIT